MFFTVLAIIINERKNPTKVALGLALVVVLRRSESLNINNFSNNGDISGSTKSTMQQLEVDDGRRDAGGGGLVEELILELQVQ